MVNVKDSAEQIFCWFLLNHIDGLGQICCCNRASLTLSFSTIDSASVSTHFILKRLPETSSTSGHKAARGERGKGKGGGKEEGEREEDRKELTIIDSGVPVMVQQ